MLSSYQLFSDLLGRILLGLALVAGAICVLDWAIRTRRINPFSGIARFVRRYIDPLMRPMETMVVRRGGQPAHAPFWMFMAIIVGGIILIQLVRVVGGLMMQVSVGVTSPFAFVMMLMGWAFRFVSFALLVRVISSWLPVSPYSKWLRWSYVSTEWLLAPLRRFIPPFGAFDITPIVAYFLLVIVGGFLGVM